MRIRFDPSLTEAVVIGEIKRREDWGDFSLSASYHQLADPIYIYCAAERRQAEFERLHEKFFRILGFADAIEAIFEEFPQVRGQVREAFIARAMTEHQEGADLSRDLKSVGVRIRPERFQALNELRSFLRRELMHVHDMLDEKFGYKPWDGPGAMSAAERNIVRDRYRVLWDIYVDSRLVREGKGSNEWRQARFRQFESLYWKLPHEVRLRAFDNLWRAERLTHLELLQIAMDARRLIRIAAGTDHEPIPPEERTILLAGMPCPLCRFPTYSWSDGLSAEVIKLIKEDFPGWEPKMGACNRCVEAYSLRAGCW